MPPQWVFFLVLLIVLDVAGDVFTKRFALGGQWLYAAIAIVLFVAASIAWIFTLRTGAALSHVIVLYSIAALIAGTFVGIVVFGETAGRLQYVGIALGIAAVVCLSIE